MSRCGAARRGASSPTDQLHHEKMKPLFATSTSTIDTTFRMVHVRDDLRLAANRARACAVAGLQPAP